MLSPTWHGNVAGQPVPTYSCVLPTVVRFQLLTTRLRPSAGDVSLLQVNSTACGSSGSSGSCRRRLAQRGGVAQVLRKYTMRALA